MTRALTEDDRIEVLPMLPSLSIAESRDFYRDKLGFDEIVHEDELPDRPARLCRA